jgi:hypothetical protein
MIVAALVTFVLVVAAISYATETVTGERGYVSCFRKANETEIDAYEKYVNTIPSSAADVAKHEADFITFERQYMKDIRDC